MNAQSFVFAEPCEGARASNDVRIGAQDHLELLQAAADAARQGRSNKMQAGSSSMSSIMNDDYMRPVRSHRVVDPQHNDQAYAAANQAAVMRQAFLTQKAVLQSSVGVTSTMQSEDRAWRPTRTDKVLTEEEARLASHARASSSGMPSIPAAKVVTVKGHLSYGDVGPNTASPATERNAVLQHRWRMKFEEVGHKPGHDDQGAILEAHRNRGEGATEVRKMMQKTSLCLGMPWALSGDEWSLHKDGPLGTK